MKATTSTAIDTLAAHWGAIEAARKAAGFDAEAPAHAVTVPQYMERHGLKWNTARRELVAMVKAGLMESGRKLAVATNGSQRMVPCFWMLECGGPSKQNRQSTKASAGTCRG